MEMKVVYQIHKWLAVIAAAATLGWFVSGVLMVVPERWLTLSPGITTGPAAEARLPGAPEFDAATVAPHAAISAVDRRVGKPVQVVGLRLRRLPGRLAYEISTERHGSHLVDAIDGTVVTVTEELAKQVVERAVGKTVRFGSVTRLTEPSLAYSGALPAYRVPLDDSKGTVFYVDSATAQIRLTDYLNRVADFLMALHGFWLLRLILPGAAVRVLMFGLAIIGTAMSLAGVVILIAQLRGWWRRSRGLAR
jgi:hypothetical protein